MSASDHSSHTVASVLDHVEKESASSASLQTQAPTPNEIFLVSRVKSRLDHACANLTPAWFSLNMGTGITSILMYNFPYPASWLRTIGTVLFVANLFIFAALAIGNVARYTRFKGLFTSTLTHPVAGLFWGTLPMGLATIIVSEAYSEMADQTEHDCLRMRAHLGRTVGSARARSLVDRRGVVNCRQFRHGIRDVSTRPAI